RALELSCNEPPGLLRRERHDSPLQWPAPAQPRVTFRVGSGIHRALHGALALPKMLLHVTIEEVRKDDGDGVAVERLSFTSEVKANDEVERVPVLIFRPAKVTKQLPAVIVLHGTGGTKEGQQPFLRQLARRGIIGVAIDARYHGERGRGPGSAA